jgi:RNA polymerase sigma-32 factor
MKLDKATDPKLQLYMKQIKQVSLLSREEEFRLARAYAQTQDKKLKASLAEANLRFVVKVAHQYSGYRFGLLDLVQEGNLGLLLGIDRFDPERGHRLISYAVWWIRATIQTYILRNWSLVRMGTTQAQRRLFFRLRSERQRFEQSLAGKEIEMDEVLAEALKVRPREVAEMEVRLRDRDRSLNVPANDDHTSPIVESLPAQGADPEAHVGQKQRRLQLVRLLDASSESLNGKERYVMEHRLLKEEPPTLLQIGNVLGISRERVRQIQTRVIGKLRQIMQQQERAAA